MRNPNLINDLTAELKPAKPNLSLSSWICFVLSLLIVAVASGVAILHFRDDLNDAFKNTEFLTQEMSLLGLALVSLFTLFYLRLPGRMEYRKSRPLVVFFGNFIFLALAFSIIRQEFKTFDHQLVWNAMLCTEKTIFLSLIPLVFLISILRNAAPTELTKTGFYIALSSVSLAAMGLHLVCVNDSPTHLLGFHIILPFFIISSLMVMLSRHLLRW